MSKLPSDPSASRVTRSAVALHHVGMQSRLHKTTTRLRVVYELSDVKDRAQAGDPVAQAEYGLRLLTGNEVEKNKREGCRWCRLAAEQGNSRGQFLLGGCYYNGEGVLPDLTRAFFWFTLAADQHLKEAVVIQRLLLPRLTRAQVQENRCRIQTWRPAVKV
jgi:TPR repeat protein